MTSQTALCLFRSLKASSHMGTIYVGITAVSTKRVSGTACDFNPSPYGGNWACLCCHMASIEIACNAEARILSILQLQYTFVYLCAALGLYPLHVTDKKIKHFFLLEKGERKTMEWNCFYCTGRRQYFLCYVCALQGFYRVCPNGTPIPHPHFL